VVLSKKMLLLAVFLNCDTMVNSMAVASSEFGVAFLVSAGRLGIMLVTTEQPYIRRGTVGV
jgi:hypothetical protein